MIGVKNYMELNNLENISYLLCGGILLLDDNEYVITVSNNNSKECISLFNKKTNMFLRHSYHRLIETESMFNPDFFPYDSSFIPRKKDNFFTLGCSNVKMLDCYICKINRNFFVIDRYLDEYKFTIALS